MALQYKRKGGGKTDREALGGKKDRETNIGRERQTDRQTETDRQTDRGGEEGDSFKSEVKSN